MLTLCWPKLPLSCPYIDPMFAYVGRGNALPHSSDRNDGGRNEVTTGWGGGPPTRSAAGAARLWPPARTRAGLRGPAAEGGLCWRYVGLSWTYVGPMLPLCWPMLAVCWPMSALCWPTKLALSCPYVGPMIAYVGAMLAEVILMLPYVDPMLA